MRRNEEIYDPSSCLNKAKPGEMLFVLLARDEAAPMVIREWAQARIILGLNKAEDKKIVDALECARIMDEERADMKLIVHSDRTIARDLGEMTEQEVEDHFQRSLEAGCKSSGLTYLAGAKRKNPDGESGFIDDDRR